MGASWYTFSTKRSVTRSVRLCCRVVTVAGTRPLRTSLHPPLVVHTLGRPSARRPAQLVEMPQNISIRSSPWLQRQVKPRFWPRSLVAQIAEHLHESRDQIALGDHQYTGSTISSAPAPRRCVRAGTGQGRQSRLPRPADRSRSPRPDAVHRFSGTSLAKQNEKREPLFSIIVLGGQRPAVSKMTASWVQPPVAIARPSHTPHPPAFDGEAAELRSAVACPPRAARDHIPGQSAKSMAALRARRED